MSPRRQRELGPLLGHVVLMLLLLTQEWRTQIRETVASWREMFRDGVVDNIVAGVTVAFVALPLNIALALACGLPASVGLITGAIVGLVTAMVSGAKLQVTGPEVALAPLCLEIVTRFGASGLVVATLIAGVVQVAFGALRVGRLIHIMPVPVIGGFMAAVGLLVIDAQLPRLLGLSGDIKGLHMLRALPDSISPAAVIGVIVVVVVVALKRLAPRVPGALCGVVVGVALLALTGWSIPTVPVFEPHMPTLGLPAFGSVDLVALLPEALALALLASIDSLLCAVSVDAATRAPRRHHSDQELIAQGIGNVLSGLIGGMPVAGAVVRSMAAVEAGATNRLAPVIQSLVLLAIFFLAAPYVDLIPVAALAGILVVVGARLIDHQALVRSWKVTRFEAVVFLATALAIIVTDFVGGVLVGVVMALVHLARRQGDLEVHEPEPAVEDDNESVRVLRLRGPVFFASHTQLDRVAQTQAKHVVIDLSDVPFFDLTGLNSFRAALRRLHERGITVVISGASAAVLATLTDADIVSMLALAPAVDVDGAIAAIAVNVANDNHALDADIDDVGALPVSSFDLDADQIPPGGADAAPSTNLVA